MPYAKAVGTFTSDRYTQTAGVVPHIRRKTNKLNFAHVFLWAVQLAGFKTLSAADKYVFTKINLAFKAFKKAKPSVNKY